MREIKFRAWHNGKMIQGVGVYEGTAIIDINEDSPYLWTAEVMQFTGLHDKNGKEIYEGDILSIDDLEDQSECHVIFHEGSFQIQFENGVIARWEPRFDSNMWVIIGNIYENPEILEGK